MTLGSARGAALTAAKGAGWDVPAAVRFRSYEPAQPERYTERYRQYVGHIQAQVPPRR
jgi:hypothetical protein